MSDNYKGIDEEGAYKSRHSTSQQSRRSTQSTSSRAAQSPQRAASRRAAATGETSAGGQNAANRRPAEGTAARSQTRQSQSSRATASGGDYIGASRRRTSPGTSAHTAPQTGSRPATHQTQSGEPRRTVSPGTGTDRPTAPGSPASRPQPSERRSAVGRYTGTGAGTGHAAETAKSGKPRGGFTVNISEDDYYDSDSTMQEINAARSMTTKAGRKTAAAPGNSLAPIDANPTTARRIVTSSMGDTYQIQDDTVIAPRQLRSRQKMVRKKNRGCIVALVYSAAVCSISILLAYYMIVGVNDMFALVKDSTEIVVDVPKNSSLDDVTQILDDSGVVDYPFFFKTYAKISKKNTGFKAGTFTLDTKSDYNQLLTKLRLPAGADKSTITVTIPEGLTVEQVAAIMEDNSVCEAENFLKTAKEAEFTQKFLSNVNTKDRPYKVEGYLYPDTYNFYLSEGSISAVNRLLNEFDRHWTSEYVEKAKERGMTMDQVIILASVVEREASKSEDRMNVASVFANRLKNSAGTGGKLQSDATRWYPYATKKELLASDKLTQAEKDDWINNNTGICDTYRLKGLPPCPICTPSMDSINAVLDHDNTGYYYFCSDAEGNFYFAKTLKQHNANLKKAGLA